MAKKWIPKNLKKNRVRDYIRNKYGKEAFTKDGDIKASYLDKATKQAKSKSMKDAINLAKRFKKMHR